MRLLIFLAVLVAVSACTRHVQGGSNVQERKAYWEQIVKREVPLGMDRSAIEEWAHKRAILLGYQPKPNENQMIGQLEYIPIDGIVCSGTTIFLDITLNNEGKAASETIKTLGNCL